MSAYISCRKMRIGWEIFALVWGSEPRLYSQTPQVKPQLCHILCDLEPLLSMPLFSPFANGDNGSPVLIGLL